MRTVLGVLLTVALAFGQTITGSSGDYKVVIEKKFTVEPGGSLNLNNMDGDIVIRASAGNRVDIREELKVKVITQEELDRIVQREMETFQQRDNNVTLNAAEAHPGLNRTFLITVPEKFNLTVRNGRGDLEIYQVNGRIDLNTAGGDVKLGELSGATEVKTAGGDLDFTGLSGTLHAYTSGGDVQLKNIFAEADITTAGGDIDLQTSKNRIVISTSGGDLELQNIGGDLNARTMGGDIRLTDATAERVALSSMGGDIEISNCRSAVEVSTEGGDIEASHLSEKISARTMGGEVHLLDLQAGASATSMGGDISIEMTLKDFSKPHALFAETTGGDLRVILPSRLPATIQAEVRLKRRADSRNDIYSDFPMTKNTEGETDHRILRSTGEINGGGDKIDLKTNGGSIYIEKGP